MPKCPDDTELAGFLNDSLTGERLVTLSEHVDGCPQCQARLDRLTEQADGAVARYKDLSGVLPDALSGAGLTPDTHVLGGKPAMPPGLAGLPRLPGFEVVGEIGRGGMGVVYKARHRRLNRLVALKMILAGSAADPRIVQRFLLEGEVLARIQHPQVVQVFEVGTYQGANEVPIPYLAMELLEGGSLARRLREQAVKAGGGPRWPAPRVAAELLEGIARAVHAAHTQGAIHRDLKPGNILFPGSAIGIPARPESKTKGGTALLRALTGAHTPPPDSSTLPKVTDFGLAKFIETGADLTHSGQIVGTPQYMAPEQAAGSRQVGPAADVYALGAILFECLAGRPPFTGAEPMSVLLKVVNESPPDVRSLRPDVPRNLAAVTMKCLEKEPGRRYASAEALAKDLRRFLDDRPTRARTVTPFERLKLWGRRNPAVAGLVAALAVVLLAAFVSVAALWVKAEGKAEDEVRAKKRSELAQVRAEQESQKAAASLGELQDQKVLAEQAQARAEQEARRAAAAAQELEKQKALLEFGRAVASCEEGRVEEGLWQFVHAAELAEKTGQADLARVARVNVAAWPRDLPPAPRRFAHKEQPRFAAFHPDGKRFVTAGRAGELYLWQIRPAEKLRTYKSASRIPGIWNSGTTYWTAAVSPDGKTIAAGGTDGAVTLWDLDSPEPKLTFDAAGGENLWSLGFAPDGALWASNGKNGLNRWDLSAKPTPKAAAAKQQSPGNNALQILVVSADGKRVYTGDRGAVVREWDAERVAELRSWKLRGWITDVAVSVDGTRLAATGSDGTVWEIDLETGREVLSISLAGAYGNGVAFAPKRPFLVASDGDGNVRFWHRDTGQPVGLPMRFQGEVMRPRFLAGSDEFAVPAGDSVHLSGVPDPPGDLLSAGRGSRIRGLAFSPTGRVGVIDERRFELLEPGNAKRVQLVEGWEEGPLALHFDPDPARPVAYRGTRKGFDRVAVPGGDKFDEAEVKHSAGLGRVHRVACLPGDGGLFVMGQAVVARYDASTLKLIEAKRPAENVPVGVELEAMALRPDGKEVLVALADRIVFLKADTLEPVREWRAREAILDACYTPDGKKVLVAMRDNKAELLDAATGAAALARALTHTRAVACVAVSADGAVLLTGSRDGVARFWDAATGLPLGAPLRHSGPVTHVAFSPRGDHIATGTGTGQVMVWDLPPRPEKGDD